MQNADDVLLVFLDQKQCDTAKTFSRAKATRLASQNFNLCNKKWCGLKMQTKPLLILKWLCRINLLWDCLSRPDLLHRLQMKKHTEGCWYAFGVVHDLEHRNLLTSSGSPSGGRWQQSCNKTTEVMHINLLFVVWEIATCFDYREVIGYVFPEFPPVKVWERRPGEPWSVPYWTALFACRAGITELGWLNWCCQTVLWTAHTAKSKVLAI